MKAPILPSSSYAQLRTQRLARPTVLWQSPQALAGGFDPECVFCCPVADEPAELYTTETRIELADRYGGVGIADAGGSGRCAAFGDVQTKGVGVTPLVGPKANSNHNNGMLTVDTGLTEALFGQIYQMALPFGAVPVHAVVIPQALSPTQHLQTTGRALVVRPFVARPAHFMRNVLNPEGRRAHGPGAPGMTRDLVRVVQSLQGLAANLQRDLGLTSASSQITEIELLNAGLAELVRRLAAQLAAAFAKRLPHGSLSCSNIALSGAFLDFGASSLHSAYRRMVMADMRQDAWDAHQWAMSTVINLREQLCRYRLGRGASELVSVQALTSQFSQLMEQRLAIEMAKMAGLTEDLAQCCAPELLTSWLASMRAIWQRGAGEQFRLLPGAMGSEEMSAKPHTPGRYDLNAILTVAGQCAEPEAMDRALAPCLEDEALRSAFVRTSVHVRAAVKSHIRDSGAGLDGYIAAQASRKNSLIKGLERDAWYRLPALFPLDRGINVGQARQLMDDMLVEASNLLSDLDPTLPGDSGKAQVSAIAARH